MAVAIIAGCLWLAFAVFAHPLARVRDSFTDSLFRRGDASPNIVLVLIGEGELNQHGRLATWPRSLHAQVIDNLRKAGARVIVYDMLFADEGPDDATLADAIARAGNVVIGAAGGTATGGDGIATYDRITLPVQSLRGAAASVAISNVVTDADGRVRRIPLVAQDAQGSAYPSLALAAFYLQCGRPVSTDLPSGGSDLQLMGRTVPLERQRALRVNFTGDRRSFTDLSFDDVLSGHVSPSQVEGKVVFVGVDAVGVDRHSTPLLGDAAGVVVQANALDTLLRARFLRVSGPWVSLLAGFVLVLVGGWLVARTKPGYAAIAIVACCVGYLVVAVFAFLQGTILDAVTPPSALLVTMLVGLVFRIFSERAAHQELTDLFGRHVSKEVVSALVDQADRGEFQLGGEVREVTVLFADIRGFTTLSGGMDPAELVKLLNDRFQIIVDCVLGQGGIVNKFVGDAVMAFWNAPADQLDHAWRACAAALEALDQLDRMPALQSPILFGFGVNTGVALAGNVGSAGRFEYTMMGETVNTASRLSGAAAGGEVWIGQGTLDALGGRLGVDPLPPQQLKGMVAPIAVYRLHRSKEAEPSRAAARQDVTP
jgi:adenylate cyclase